jgi:hypothetical protein
MQIYDYDGNATFNGVWTTITSARSFASALLTVPMGATHWVRYTTGATAALAVGEQIEGETSSATATLVGQAIDQGTAGDGDLGIVFVKDVSGAFVAETIHGNTTNGHVGIIQAPIALRSQLTHPKAVLISVDTGSASLTIAIDGTTPTVSAGTNNGIIVTAGQNWVIRGHNNLRNFKAINTANGNNSIMKYIMYV